MRHMTRGFRWVTDVVVMARCFSTCYHGTYILTCMLCRERVFLAGVVGTRNDRVANLECNIKCQVQRPGAVARCHALEYENR